MVAFRLSEGTGGAKHAKGQPMEDDGGYRVCHRRRRPTSGVLSREGNATFGTSRCGAERQASRAIAGSRRSISAVGRKPWDIAAGMNQDGLRGAQGMKREPRASTLPLRVFEQY